MYQGVKIHSFYIYDHARFQIAHKRGWNHQIDLFRLHIHNKTHKLKENQSRSHLLKDNLMGKLLVQD